MAELRIDGDELVLAMRPAERLWSLHRDIRIPLSSIRRLRVPSSPWLTMRGWRATGVAIPGYRAMGKRRHADGWDFSMVRDKVPSLIVEVNGYEFGELTVSVGDPVTVGQRIADAAGISFDPTPDRGRLGRL